MLRKIVNIFVATTLLWFLVASSAIASVFAVIGDFGDGSTEESNVMGTLSGWNPEFIITMGDNRYNMSYETDYDLTVGRDYCAWLKAAGSGTYCSGNLSQINAFFPSLGNHDYTDGSGLAEYLNYFTLPGTGVNGSGTSGNERYYDFIKGPVHFFVIDSQGAITDPGDKVAQMDWLQTQLAASSSPWNIVYFHHAPYSSGPHGSNPAMQWPFAAWGADAVISGHDHTYERIFADGIVYFVNGLGGRSLYSWGSTVNGSQARYNGNYGAMRVDASDSAIMFEFIDINGSIQDTYTIEASASSTPAAPGAVSATDNQNGTAKVSWSDLSDNEQGFQVERAKQNKRGKWVGSSVVATTGPDATSIDDPSGAGTYRYRVGAFNTVGVSWSSPWIEVTVTDTGSGGGGGGRPPSKGYCKKHPDDPACPA